jgi:SAM-dependent methyltransferase
LAQSLAVPSPGQPIQALDIGAGIGKGMRAMTAAGMDVWGIEPSASFRAAALQMGIDPTRLVAQPLEGASFERNKFDFVTFGAVLEHLPNPAQALERALGWLRPNGVLHAEVPSSDWLVARLVNTYFRLTGTEFVTQTSPMHAPFHLFEFTPESFLRNGERVGYHVVRVDRFTCGSLAGVALIDRALQRIMRATGTGMQLGLWLRKRV